MPSSLRKPQRVVVARHTAPRLHARHPLHTHMSAATRSILRNRHRSVQTYVFFLFVRPFSTSCSPLGVLPRQRATPAYRAHRDSMPSRLRFAPIWRRRSIAKERWRWVCRGVVSVSNVGSSREVARRRIAAMPSTRLLAATSEPPNETNFLVIRCIETPEAVR